MIIKGIPFRIWEKVIRFGTGFFFVTAIISPFLALILYVFEADFEYLFVKTDAGKKTLSKQTFETNDPGLIDPLLDINHTPYIPIPDIENNISFIHYNDRPDISKTNNRQISLATKNSSLIAKENEQIYLDCKDLKTISFSKDKTPYSITPISIQGDKLFLEFEVIYKTKENLTLFQNIEKIELKKTPQKCTTLTKEATSAKKSISQALYFSPDKLISLLGGKEYKDRKNLSRIYFKNNSKKPILYIKTGDLICYENNKWIKAQGTTKGKPLFKINSISNNELIGTFWNESGFFEKTFSIIRTKNSKSTFNGFFFDKLYKRNNESVICKIQEKTFILKPHDWLIKKQPSWRHLTTVEEFNSLIDFRSSNEIIIFDKIKQENENEIFMGYIFDQTRSNYKKLEIVLKKKGSFSYNS